MNEPKFLDTYQSTVFIGSPVPNGLGAWSEQVNLTYAVAVDGKTCRLLLLNT